MSVPPTAVMPCAMVVAESSVSLSGKSFAAPVVHHPDVSIDVPGAVNRHIISINTGKSTLLRALFPKRLTTSEAPVVGRRVRNVVGRRLSPSNIAFAIHGPIRTNLRVGLGIHASLPIELAGVHVLASSHI